ncbi:hypothetical protein ACFQ3Y_24945 [Paenibacillus motobuensis]|uniref:hypothetical protein n=1 Tax=Paenibacillus motobuensis TaxID=295324 RepID=UPI00363AF028
MAKLNVVIPSVDVEIDGVKYRKVDRDAKTGDVVRIIEDGYICVEKGAFYPVEDGSKYGHPGVLSIVDSSGTFRWGKLSEGEDWEVYEKVAELAAQQYREVKRRAEVGERIRIVDVYEFEDGYAQGDEFIVNTTFGDGDVCVTAGGRNDKLVVLSEYVVLEPIEPAQPKRLTVGDYAKVINPRPTRYHRFDHIVEITHDEHDYQPYEGRSVSDGGSNWYYEDELIRATEAEVAAAKQAVKYGDFNNGDYAQIVGDDQDGLNNTASKNIGKFAKVSRVNGFRGLQLHGPNGVWLGIANASALRKVTEEEYETATDPRSKFAKGDKVRLISGGQGTGLFGFNNGSIYVVDDPKTLNWNSKRVRIKHVVGSGGGYAKPEQLEKVSAEEIAEIERKQAEEAKWAAIGRKVNEYKRGDVVKCIGLAAETAGYGEVLADPTAKRVQVRYYNHFGICAEPFNIITLITPVEQRFDREEKAAA